MLHIPCKTTILSNILIWTSHFVFFFFSTLLTPWNRVIIKSNTWKNRFGLWQLRWIYFLFSQSFLCFLSAYFLLIWRWCQCICVNHRLILVRFNGSLLLVRTTKHEFISDKSYFRITLTQVNFAKQQKSKKGGKCPWIHATFNTHKIDMILKRCIS